MDHEKKRVLGRALAVEETRHVSGADRVVSTLVDFDNVDTSPLADSSIPTSEGSSPAADSGTVQQDSGTVSDTSPFSDSGTVIDTGVGIDCAESGTTLDDCLVPGG
jgi:hypothetical protein